MIGAMVLKRYFEKNHVAEFEARDAAYVDKFPEDVTITFAGGPPIVGKQAVREFEQSFFASMKDLKVVTRTVAVARPWAFGLTNTLMIEDEYHVERHDGRKETLYDLISIDVVKGKVVATRGYLADRDAEKVALGVT